jgi:hypothetical protein
MNSETEPQTHHVNNKTPRQAAALIASCLAVVAALLYGYMFITTPVAVRVPALEHAHARLQIIVDGRPVNFADDAFQVHYAQACTDAIAADPIHFHDKKDQFIHLHWKDMTGGLILKNYGWNLVGGADDTLGYRFDHILPERVPTHDENLPKAPQGSALWVYTGDESAYRERAAADFLYQDIETFLGRQSTVSQQAWLDGLLFKRASAHNGESHDEAELTRINNLLGNIVIFAQKDKPSDVAVMERFKHLEPLTASTCGG